MRIVKYPTAEAFGQATQAYLLRHEVANQLTLSNILRKTGEHFAAVWDGDELVLAACVQLPHDLVLSHANADSRTVEAASLIAESAFTEGPELPGVMGDGKLAETFSAEYTRRAGRHYTLHKGLCVLQLMRVISPPPCAGVFRAAVESDVPLIAEWLHCFRRDVRLACTHEEAHEEATTRVGSQSYYLWEDGGVVSMAAKTRPLLSTIAVNSVYTPPENRRRGYASSCVAALSQLLLDSGHKYCSLYTDLENPTSNHIYRSIGYEPVCEVAEFQFK
jgi:uncharacterized protein